jgi:hypothetical protein
MTKEEALIRVKGILTDCIPLEDSGEIDEIMKALEQEPRKGHWIMTHDYLTTADGSVDYVKCSCCGEDSLEEGNYCPNCGVEMESEVRE